MNSKKTVAILAAVVILILTVVACSTGISLGGQSTSTIQTTPLPATATARDDLFKPFWEAWQIVHDQYVDQPLDDEALMRGAIKGMLDSLGDQHTTYMSPQEYKDATDLLAGEYEGIGAWVNTDKEYLTIVEPMTGSPAEKVGLQAGDEVIAIDGEDMTGIDPEMARLKVLGPKGSTVRLTIRREGSEDPIEVEIQRASIVVPSVETEMLDGNIAYIRLYTFGDTTAADLHAALEEIMKQEPAGIILDLRNNTGGYLRAAIQISSEFISDGVVLYEEFGDGERKTYSAQSGGLAIDIPMVVLINEWSASASEIVAGAIQDRERGLLIGVTSFGKGSVQNWVPLSDEQGAVRVTIARWLTPDEHQIHKIGLTPDVEVKLTEEDTKAKRDPQLDKAVEVLTSK